VGGRQVIAHKITVGGFVMFNTYMSMLVWPMIALGWVVNLMQRGTASLARIDEIMREQPGIVGPERTLATVRGEIELRAVSVEYPGALALNSVNLRIPAGKTIAVVGHTGSGKSTLMSLIPRLMDPTRGVVTLDGVDIRENFARVLEGADWIRAAGDISVQCDHCGEYSVRR
jgi:ATP-binding cassette subfamily B multidrug efflux pump